MIAAAGGVNGGSPTELAHADDHGFIEQAVLAEVFDQRRSGPIFIPA